VSDSQKTNRRSGRTQFMLIAALMAHDKGRAVYVMGFNEAHVMTLRQQFNEVLGRLGRDPDEQGLSSIKFETSSSLENFNWETGRLSGNPNCTVFVDHHAIEAKFAWLFHEQARWNK